MKVNYLVLGQGLAGSILAWELMQHECKILVIDNEKNNAASRVAAGLINPVTGQRMVKTGNADTCLSFAIDYYRQLEKTFQQAFYHAMPMLRLFRSKADLDRGKNRANDPAYQAYLGDTFLPGQSGEPINDTFGGIEQRQTGYLSIGPLLSTLKEHFKKQRAYVSTQFNYQDLIMHDGGVQWQDYQADFVIFCEGADAVDNPWFRWLPFQLSKGEIITVHSDKPLPAKIINDGHWLVPLEERRSNIGATFSWEWPDEEPSRDARQQLLAACEKITGSDNSLSVAEHRAGIRPTTRDKHPFVGIHPCHKRMAIFNGFGAKGSMLIPYFATKLVAHFMYNEPVPAQSNIDRFESGQSLTTLARRYLSETIKPGDVVIDATVGNGFDTEFLARCIGRSGQVIGFDIQQDAIVATKQKLATLRLLDRVSLHQVNHGNMSEYIDRSLHGNIAAITFNLGYLPGSVKTVTTQSATTLDALQQAIELIKPGGIISVVAYRGHQGGESEMSRIKKRFSDTSDKNLNVKIMCPNDISGRAPELIIITKSG